MKRIFTILLTLFAVGMAFAQNAPITFEPGEPGNAWTWTVFENDTNPAIEIVANPDPFGANTSATVAKYTALQSGNPWAGCESMHGSDLGPFVLDATNSTIKIMVWKSVISDVGIKMAAPTGWSQVEVKVSNTLVNQWEELTFDFSNYINPPTGEGQLDQFIFFPDFNLDGRAQDNIIYFDNVTFNASTPSANVPMVAAPTPPAREAAEVISVFSGAYAQVPGTDFNPNWGQSTIVATIDIENNATLRYANFNYQGTQFGSALNVSALDRLHVDMWTANATTVNVFCVSTGPMEAAFSLPVTPGQWVSYDIPLTAFGAVNLQDVIQFKFDGGDGSPVIFLDNLYFYKNTAAPAAPMVAAPTPPARAASNVISVFSGAYAQVPGTDFNPNWGQATVTTTIDIEANATLRYANFNYQGTQFASPLNVAEMEKLHVDMWTADATAVNVFAISTGPVETAYALPITPGQWRSYDIPLTAFANVNLQDVIQFKFDGGNGTPTIYLDNLYFYRGTTSVTTLAEQRVRFFPNPAALGTPIQLNEAAEQVEIFDLAGKRLSTTYNTATISTDHLGQSGVYIVKFHLTDGSILAKKLVLN